MDLIPSESRKFVIGSKQGWFLMVRSHRHIRTLWAIFIQDRVEVIMVLFLVAVSAGLIILVPFWVRTLINEVILKKDFVLLVKHLFLGLLLFLSILSFEFGREVTKFRLSNRIGAVIRERLFNKILTIPLSIMSEHRLGDLISRLSNDITVLGDGFRFGFLNLVPNILIVFGLTVLMIWQSLSLSIITTILISPMAFSRMAGLVT